jgi:hypothetical protein
MRALCERLLIVAAFAAALPIGAEDVIRIPILAAHADLMFQMHYGHKWGYIDRTGKKVIPPQFDDEGDFFGGLAKVRLGDKWGYINKSGRPTIPYKFQAAGDFSEGLAPVMFGRKWGFINRGGSIVIRPQFQAASEFRDGLALFEIWDTIQCEDQSVSTKNNAPTYAFRLHLHNPVACFSQNAHFGFVDHSGTPVIPPTLALAADFSEGLACVKLQASRDARFGYIDKEGKLAIKPEYEQALAFSDGLAAVEVVSKINKGEAVESKWGFINRNGSWAIKPIFYEARSFSEGLAAVALRPGKWGYVNKNGVFVIPPKYSDAQRFSDGLALVWPSQDLSA